MFQATNLRHMTMFPMRNHTRKVYLNSMQRMGNQRACFGNSSVAYNVDEKSRPRVVILGSGYSSFALAKNIDRERFDVTMISPRNHMLFTPLLTSASVGTLEFRSISEPVRFSLPDIKFIQGRCSSVDHKQNQIMVQSQVHPSKGDTCLATSAKIDYDILVIGVGAKSATFGIKDLEQHVHFLKSLDDARQIRQHIIRNIESASLPSLSQADRDRLLSFVIVGGGPTGVEFAAELHDFVYQDVTKLYPEISSSITLTIVEGKDILGAFDRSLRDFARRKFARENIRLRTGVSVKAIDSEKLYLSDESVMEYGHCVWSTGVSPQPFIRNLEADIFSKDQAGRLQTDQHLRVLSANEQSKKLSSLKPFNNIFAIGDCANVDSKEYAATAQVAEQQGTYLANQLNKYYSAEHETQSHQYTCNTQDSMEPFRYRHGGSLAYIGEFTALSDFKNADATVTQATGFQGHTIRGFIAWIIWRSVYLTKLGTWRNRMQVPMDWFRTFFFGRDTSLF